MTEITFKIEHCDDCEKVTILENGIKQQVHIYHKGTDDGLLIIYTTADWYGITLEELLEREYE